MTHATVVIQARMSSTRLPGKVLLPLLGLPSIIFMVQRVRQAVCIDRLIVATSTDLSDDPLAQVLAGHGVECFRGDLHDVLDRFHRAAATAQARCVIRLTGDCPLIDADLIDAVARPVIDGQADYASNTEPASYPDGLDVEAFTFAALETAGREATLPSDREHVTPFLRKHPERFRRVAVTGLADLSALRWTVDHADDHAHVSRLLAAVRAQGPTGFDRFDLYRAIEREPALRTARVHERNEGYQKSLRSDPQGPA